MPLTYKDTSAPVCEPVTIAQAKQQCVIDATNTDDDQFVGRLIRAARQHVERIMQRAIYPRAMQLFLDFFPFPDYNGTVNPNDRHVLYGEFWHALAIRLPRPRALAVQSITYIDLNGNPQTIDPSTYYLAQNSEPGRIVPRPGVYWPYTQSWLPDSVCISYTTGTYVIPVMSEAVVVASDGSLPLSQLSKYVGMLSLVDSGGNPVAFTNQVASPGLAALPPKVTTAAGTTLTASYYVDDCPETVRQAMLLLISYWYNHRDAAEQQPPKDIDDGVRDLLGAETFETFGF